MAAAKKEQGDTSCNITIRAIRIYYCDENGRPHNDLVDLDKVQALSWCMGESVKAKVKQPTVKGSVPTRKGGVGPCSKTKTALPDPSTLCWYDGEKWVCGSVE